MNEEVCSQCNGTGWVLETDSSGKSVAKRCSCFIENKVKVLLKQANLPNRYKDCSFDSFEIHNTSHKNALKISKKFVSNYPVQDIGLLFQGPCGVGKTHLAVAIINELIKVKSATCYFCDFRDLIRNIQKSYSAESTLSESELIAPIFANNVLVLDELGAKRTSPWVEETVFYIINHRYNHKKLTLFTSNYLDRGEEEEDKREPFFKGKQQEDSLVDRIGVRLRSRIYEMCKLVTIKGDDYRKKVKQAGYRF
ncbi:MAG: AAA family ATPase [Candidatus Aminicenantes bacterium]|nr:AAA family ATPase [Candidatus Aminicenantes bacterium]